MNYRCVPRTNIIIRQGCLLINGEIDWCTVTFHVIISQSKYFKDFIRVFLVCCFLFSQTLNRELFCASRLYYLTFFISFFLNHMGDIETGGKEDTHEDTVKWPKQFRETAAIENEKSGPNKCKTILRENNLQRYWMRGYEQAAGLSGFSLSSSFCSSNAFSCHQTLQARGKSVWCSQDFCFVFCKRLSIVWE